jgi:hypothetical protein
MQPETQISPQEIQQDGLKLLHVHEARGLTRNVWDQVLKLAAVGSPWHKKVCF